MNTIGRRNSSVKAIFLIFFALLLFFIDSSVQAQSGDAIAMRVVANSDRYSALRWYQEKAVLKGSPQLLTVDGYPAIRDGRTVYVSAANVNLATNELFTNLYIISFNQNAEKATEDIFGEILAKWRFNINLDVFPGSCSEKSDLVCLTDDVCSGYGFCSSLKAMVTRDVIRMSQLVEMRKTVEDYRIANGRYPALAAGSYLPNKSVSTWPSWQDTLGKTLGKTLSVDPRNDLAPCTSGGYDEKTCWNQTDQTFYWAAELNAGTIPSGNYVYIYRATINGGSYDLCAAAETIYMPPPYACNAACLPFCFGKDCGSDGCTGSCGTCAPGDDCSLPAGVCTGACSSPAFCSLTAPTNSDSAIGTCASGACYTCETSFSWDGTNCINTCIDSDNDDFSAAGGGMCCGLTNASACPAAPDCNDIPPAGAPQNPGAPENTAALCNDTIDNDCDGLTNCADPDCAALPLCTAAICADADSDDYSATGGGMCCGPTNVTACLPAADCGDTNAAQNPGAPENTAALCNDTIDNDCDGLINCADPDCAALPLCAAAICADADNDDYSATGGGMCCGTTDTSACPAAADCNDLLATQNPGVPEICDGLDNDCDGTADEGCDVDNDNYCACSQIFTYGSDLRAVCSGTNTTDAASIANTCDCNDTPPTGMFVNPGVTEVCNNSADDNCNGDFDCDDADCSGSPFCVACTDSDNDNYSAAGGGMCCGLTDTSACPAAADCGDTNAAQNPDARENTATLCNDTIDNDCDGLTNCADPDCAALPLCATCVDSDGDGYDTCNDGAPGDTDGRPADCNDGDPNNWNACTTCADADGDIYFAGCNAYSTINGPDCNDLSAAIRPGAIEVCDNVDNNCVNGIDEACDNDNDDYCDNMMFVNAASVAVCLNTSVTPGTLGDDCNDTNYNAWSACATCNDTDTDGWYELCNNYTGILGPDCADTDAGRNPGLPEFCGNLIDEDCDGAAPSCPIPACTFNPAVPLPCTF